MKAESTAKADSTWKPYRPSWIDSLTQRVESLPAPAWSWYLSLLVIMVLLNNARQWLDGKAAPGVFDVARSTDAVYTVYFLALVHHLNVVARRAFMSFSPLLGASEDQKGQMLYRLTTLPWRHGLLALVVGVVLTVAAILFDPDTFGLALDTSAASWIYVTIIASFNTSALVAFVLHGYRQLRLVDQFHSQVDHIDLLDLTPVYAFSALTARTGLGLIFFSWFLSVSDPTPVLNPVTIIGLAASLLLGIASFVIPLNGMHRLLVAEKEKHVQGVSRRLAQAFEQIHRAVDNQSWEAIGPLNVGITALRAELETLDQLPTWPWRPETLRGFTTAIVVPVVVWTLTTILGQLVGP